jgi:hypothetical protein
VPVHAGPDLRYHDRVGTVARSPDLTVEVPALRPKLGTVESESRRSPWRAVAAARSHCERALRSRPHPTNASHGAVDAEAAQPNAAGLRCCRKRSAASTECARLRPHPKGRENDRRPRGHDEIGADEVAEALQFRMSSLTIR